MPDDERRWLLLGNCQIHGLANCLEMLSPGLEVEPVDEPTYERDAEALHRRLGDFDRIVGLDALLERLPRETIRPGVRVRLPVVIFSGFPSRHLLSLGRRSVCPWAVTTTTRTWRRGSHVALQRRSIALATVSESVRALTNGRVAFGTSGARGLVADLSDDVCAAYATAFIAVMRRGFVFDRIALGMDLRPSSPRIAAACMAAIRAAGLEVDWCGELPTPALALHGMARGIPALMVSGSHIPFDRNGLKFYRPDGEISKDDEHAILAVDGPLPALPDEALPPAAPAARDAYMRRYLDYFPARMLDGLRIGLYEHSSVSRDVFADILRGLGATVVSLGRTDDFVPIDTEAVSPGDAARGKAWSSAHRLDAIISTDGDGDRPLVADEQGHWLRGDIVGLLCARELGVQAVAVPVSCNTAIEASGAFAEVLRTRIGSPHVIAGMQVLQQRHARVGGFEANGGFLLGCPVAAGGGVLQALPTRDAVLPALAVLSAAMRAGVPLSRLADDVQRRFTASDRLQAFPTERSRGLISRWTDAPEALLEWLDPALAPVSSVDVTDGLRLGLANGEVIHLRPSGNAPELRCYVEADAQDRAETLVRLVLGRLTEMQEVK